MTNGRIRLFRNLRAGPLCFTGGKKVEIQNPRIVLYTGVLVDEKKRVIEFGYFFRLVYNKNLPILVIIFFNRIFFVKHNKNLSILADFFWAEAVRPFGRARSNFSLFCRHFGKF